MKNFILALGNKKDIFGVIGVLIYISYFAYIIIAVFMCGFILLAEIFLKISLLTFCPLYGLVLRNPNEIVNFGTEEDHDFGGTTSLEE